MAKEEKQKLTLGAVVLEPGSTRRYKTGTWRTFMPILLKEKCTKCAICWRYCPDSAIKKNEKGEFYIDYYYCKGCLICVNECPAKAIIKEVEKK